MKKVSVLVCSYNDADFVQKACESLYQQTLPQEECEILFVDDGSTDGTEEILGPFREESNFRYLKNEKNLGLAAACNRGLEEARGEYLVRLDSDDVFNPALLQTMSAVLDRGETDLVYSDRWEWVVSSNRFHRIQMGEEFNLYDLIAIGTMMRRELLLEIGGYRNLFWEEYDLYLRYLLRSSRPPFHVPQLLYTQSIRPGSMTSNPKAVEEGWKELQRHWSPEILQRFGPLPFPKNGRG